MGAVSSLVGEWRIVLLKDTKRVSEAWGTRRKRFGVLREYHFRVSVNLDWYRRDRRLRERSELSDFGEEGTVEHRATCVGNRDQVKRVISIALVE